jgi:hydrophobe/amphiphile efflux-1 (HAE1) family protein
MNLIKISIERPVFAWVVMFSLIIFGGISGLRLGVSQMPDVDFPVLSISLSYDGASPEVIEAEILDKYERRLAGLEGLIEIKTSARTGSANIQLEFDIKKNIDVALQEVQTAISQVRLPQAITEAPIIRKSNPEEDPIMFMGFWSDRPILELMEYLELSILPSFQSISGVGEVSIAGFSTQNLRVWLDIKKLNSADLTVTDIIDSISQQHVELPLGLVTNKSREVSSRLMGESIDAISFGNLPVLRRAGQIIHDRTYKIKDFARVEDGLTDVRRIAEVDGKNAISLLVRKQRGTNEVAVAKQIRAHFTKIEEQLPRGFYGRINVDYTKSTESIVNSTLIKLAMATLVTVLIVFFMLGNFASAVNVLLSIPTSLVGTFIVMYFGGFTFNLFSLLALALVVSIVIDDAIMVLENIIRHRKMGKSAKQASYDGTTEILGATIASTLAVAAVFIPVIFMGGVTGKFFYQFGVVMSVAVFLSLLDAVTITPMRASQLLKEHTKASRFELAVDRIFTKMAGYYQHILELVLKRAGWALILGLFFFVSSLYLTRQIKREFVPPQDQNFLLLSFQTRLDSAIEETYKKGQEVAAVLKTIPHIQGYFISVGVGGQSIAANQGFIPLILTPQESRSINHLGVMEQVRQSLKSVSGIKVQIRDVSTRGLTSGRSFPVAFNIRGPDLDVLDEKANLIKQELEKTNLVQDLDTDFKKGNKEIQLLPIRDKMKLYGVSMDSISKTLQVLVGGFINGQITQSGRRFDIRLKAQNDTIREAKDFKNIYVRNIAGNMEPLSTFVDIKEVEVVQSINRINRQRAISIFGSLASGASQGEALNQAEKIATKLLPAGYQFALEGASGQLQESFKSIIFALILGLIVAYLVLAVQYNSFVHPLSVMAALPFALSGALFALWISSNSLNLFSLIGIVVLMGIAKKNSILIVEFANHLRAEKPELSLAYAIAQASSVRLRPILMTSLATFLAALPLIFKSGMGKEATASMAITVAGGIVISTLLTLFIVPALYYKLVPFEKN